jgi:hypothetical protein
MHPSLWAAVKTPNYQCLFFYAFYLTYSKISDFIIRQQSFKRTGGNIFIDEEIGVRGRKFSENCGDVPTADRFLECVNGHKAVACMEDEGSNSLIVCSQCSAIFSGGGPNGPYWELINTQRLANMIAPITRRFHLAITPLGFVPVPVQ